MSIDEIDRENSSFYTLFTPIITIDWDQGCSSAPGTKFYLKPRCEFQSYTHGSALLITEQQP